MESRPQLTMRKLTTEEAAAGLKYVPIDQQSVDIAMRLGFDFSDQTVLHMPLQYDFVFNMCNCLLTSQSSIISSVEVIAPGDYKHGWSLYHQHGNSWSDNILQTMAAFGMMNYYLQSALELQVDLNVDYDITKPNDEIENPIIKKNKIIAVQSLTNFLDLPEGLTQEEINEELWHAMKRLKFLLGGDYWQKLPKEIVAIGAAYQRYKVVLEKYQSIVDYAELQKLVALVDILQSNIIDFVNRNKETMSAFLKDRTIRIKYNSGFPNNPDIFWHPKIASPDVLTLMSIDEFTAPLQVVTLESVGKRLSLFDIIE